MRYLIIPIVVVAIDAWTKLWSVTTLADGHIIRLAEFANLRLAFNYGSAFSFLSDAGGWQRWFFIAIASAMSIALTVVLVARLYQSRWSAVGYALLLGGAVGNLIDRIRLGYVVDMIDLHAGGWHWPTFNIADSAIFVGIALLLLEAFGVAGKAQPASES